MKAIRIIKVGGSLLDLPDLPSRFEAWFALQHEACSLAVVGGGKMADAIRAYDQIHNLAAATAHRLAIQAMSLSARIFAELMPKLLFVSEHVDPRSIPCNNSPMLFDALQFLEYLEPKLAGRSLPANWTVTSDSIAARIACVVGAFELVLLKSCDLREDAGLEELAAANHLDAHFPEAAAGVPRVRWVNLRKAGFPTWNMLAKSCQ